MYYYAIVDENNVCTSVHASETEINLSNYIPIAESQYNNPAIVGMTYNMDTGLWESDETYFYAFLNENGIVQLVEEWGSEITNSDNVVRIDSLDQSLIGKYYDSTTGQFVDPTFRNLAAHSTDEINVGTTDESLTTRLNNTYTKSEVNQAITDASLVVSHQELTKRVAALEQK